MVFQFPDKYISLLTDFGFKRVFGTEPNKRLLIDFLNTLLPDRHQVQDLTFKSNENLGVTPLDRKAIFDIYCQAISGERFIVEIQKAKQNFFKDRSVYYATFPIQEQAIKGEWDFNLSAVYTIGVLDFIFDDHKDEETMIHVVQLQNQHCQVFYDKLKFIYIELPKFTKLLNELETHLDKWLFLLKHLAQLDEPPSRLQEPVFNELFEAAEIANFSTLEQQNYQNSLKYYRDMNNIMDTARQEARQAGWTEGRTAGWTDGRTEGLFALILRQLNRRFGSIAPSLEEQVRELDLDRLEALGEDLVDFMTIQDLVDWLTLS
jgi:predicted transposase/invertase (TIGR01784 family)